MNEGNNNTKVKDFSDEVKGIAGLVREKYQNVLKHTLFNIEENQTILDKGVKEQLNSNLDYTDSER